MAESNNGTKVAQGRRRGVDLDTLKVPLEVARQVKIAAATEGRFIYEVMQDAWNLYRAENGASTHA